MDRYPHREQDQGHALHRSEQLATAKRLFKVVVCGLTSVTSSQGNLCLGGTIARYNSNILSSGSGGTYQMAVDLTLLPPPINMAVSRGDTWNFQTWFRDSNPTNTSNFTDGISILFN